MIEINSALVILMAEIMLGMLALAVGLYLYTRSKKVRDIVDIETFVGEMDEDQARNRQRLKAILHDDCKIVAHYAEETIRALNQAEREIMQKIIQLYMQREPLLLREIEQLLSGLSDPVCKILLNYATVKHNSDNENAEIADEETPELAYVNLQLSNQLETALHTIEEMSAEYTRVFSGHQSTLELENSLNKMLHVFKEAEKRLHHPETQKDQ